MKDACGSESLLGTCQFLGLVLQQEGRIDMKAKLKDLLSSDLDLRNYWPEDERNFGFWVSMLIGPDDEEGSEIFQLLICTPDWIKSEYHNSSAVWGRHMLIVFEYDLGAIKTEIERYLGSCVGDDWHSLAMKVSRVASWEFEEYQP